MNGVRILVVEDEAPLRGALVQALSSEGFAVREAEDGEKGLAMALSEGPEVILLDLSLPGRDGLEVLAELRRDALESAVIVLTARGEEEDRLAGFERGADDYVVKPFSMRELLMRVRAVLARSEGVAPGVGDPPGKATFGDVRVDFEQQRLECRGEVHALTRRESELLRYFCLHEGETLDRGRLIADLWGEGEFPTTRTVDNHVLKLRKKIEPDPEVPRHLITVHGAGYRFSRRGE